MAIWIFPPLVKLAAEIIFFLIVASLSLGIFFKTRDIYSLSKHRGLFHFRNIFLYFSLAYFFVLFMLAVQLSFLYFGNRFMTEVVVMLLFGYFSTMAILSIGATVLIKNIRMSRSSLNSFLHFIALIVSALTILTRSTELLLMVQLLVLLGSFMVVILRSRSKKFPHLTQNRLTYALLLTFWIASVLAMSRGLFPVKIGLYALSTLIFLWIFLRVNKRLNLHAKEKGKARDHK